MSEKIEDKLTKQLCEAICTLKTEEEVTRFLEDVCTISEFKSIAQRYEVARLLSECVKYDDIVKETGASTATISRVKRCLVYGADGYSLVLDRMKKKYNEPVSDLAERKSRFEKGRAEIKRALENNEVD